VEGLIELGLSLPTLIAQLINFGILLLLMYMFAYKPFMRMLDERAQKAQESLEQAEYAKKKADEADKEAARRIEEASREGKQILDKAAQNGETVREKALKEARSEAEKLITRARVEIEQERDEAVGELRREFADITVRAAEKVIKRSLDKEAQHDLIEQVLEESTGFKAG
jgi:F-type H+-transporting ATPase subunit b